MPIYTQSRQGIRVYSTIRERSPVSVPVHRSSRITDGTSYLASIEYDLALLENAHPDQPPAGMVIVNDGQRSDGPFQLSQAISSRRYRVVSVHVGIPAALNLALRLAATN